MRGTTVEDAYDLVLAAGTWAEPSRIDELWAGAKRIVACDGALQRCLRTGRSPDVVVGDMDSVEPDALAAFTASEVRWWCWTSRTVTTSQKRWTGLRRRERSDASSSVQPVAMVSTNGPIF